MIRHFFALETSGRRWSAEQLGGWARACQERLRENGLAAGQVIGLIGPNSPEYVAALLGSWLALGIVLPLNPRLPQLQREQLQLRAGARWCLGGEGRRYMDWADLPRTAGSGPGQGLSHTPQTPFTLLATSGSSGAPKLVFHRYGQLIENVLSFQARFGLQPADRWLLALPLYHVGGLAILLRCAHAGATVVMPEVGQDLAEALTRLQPSHLSLVATQLQRLLAQPEAVAVLQKAKFILLGGSAIPRRLLENSLALGLPIHTSYGSTETGSLISCTASGADLETLLTAGELLPQHRLRIADEGEIQINTAFSVCEGYFESQASLEELCRAPGSVFSHPHAFEHRLSRDAGQTWYRSRDKGYFDAAGRLRITGRLDNLFISGGENIQPEEIEALLLGEQGITQALVVPVDDSEYGQRPVAFVAAEAWAPVPWRAALRERLPSFKLPDAFYPWPADQLGLKPSRPVFAELARRLRAQA